MGAYGISTVTNLESLALHRVGPDACHLALTTHDAVCHLSGPFVKYNSLPSRLPSTSWILAKTADASEAALKLTELILRRAAVSDCDCTCTVAKKSIIADRIDMRVATEERETV